MIPYCLRTVVLVAFVSATAGCGVVQPPSQEKKGTREVRRPAQTGTYISRTERVPAKAGDRQKKVKAPKATPTPKPKREKPKKPGKVDEDFVTRGGFR
jgi:hypothetical protein